MQQDPSSDRRCRERRNQAIELLRLVAAFGVVAFHSPVAGKDLAYAGLAVFVLLSPMVDARYNWERRRSTRELAKLLLVPWVFWCAAYLAIGSSTGKPPVRLGHGVVSAILVGSAPHLWFLPFLFTALVLIDRLKGRLSLRACLVVAVVAASGLLATAGWWRQWSMPPPAGQWMQALPLVFMGLAFGLADRVRAPFAVLLPMLVALGFAMAQAVRGISLPYGVATLLVLAAVWVGPRLPRSFNVEAASRCMMGVYLVHGAWLTLIWPLFARIGFWAVPLAFGASLASVYLSRKYVPRTRALL